MHRRTVLALVGGVVSCGCAGPGAAPGNESAGETRTDTGTVRPEPVRLSGSGTGSEGPFALGPGLTVVSFDCRPTDAEFVAQFVKSDNPDDTELLNALGETSGRTAFGVPGGEYELSVETEGEWTVTVEQPGADDVEAAAPIPTTEDGDGSDVRGPFEFAGAVDVFATHEGDEEFDVEVLDERGGSIADNLFDTTGPFEGEATFTHGGYGWFDVTTLGSWSLDVEQG